MATAKRKKRPVLVTTEHRGVFVGWTTDPPTKETITLTKARMVIYWSSDTRGVLGIATKGLGSGSRVTSAVDSITLRAITAVTDATPDAVKTWEAEPWS